MQRLISFAVCATLGALTFGLSGCGPASFLITQVPASRDLDESVVLREGFWASQKIALIDVDGVLTNAREQPFIGPAGDNPVSLFKEKLDKAARDKSVRAVVLRINSPGGGVTASDLMYRELLRFRTKTGKPVVACLLDVAASGGYYLACGADRIVAHPTTVTGSIGVIMMTPDLSGTMQKIGVRANVIKSGPMKDSGSPFRPMDDADRAIFQGIIDAMYERFVDVVAQSRPQLDRERIRTLADGRVYLAGEAKEHGLIDALGDPRDAIDAAKAAANLADTDVLVVQYARPLGHRPNYYAEAPAGASPAANVQFNLLNLTLPGWLESASPQFMYLWAP